MRTHLLQTEDGTQVLNITAVGVRDSADVFVMNRQFDLQAEQEFGFLQMSHGDMSYRQHAAAMEDALSHYGDLFLKEFLCGLAAGNRDTKDRLIRLCGEISGEDPWPVLGQAAETIQDVLKRQKEGGSSGSR